MRRERTTTSASSDGKRNVWRNSETRRQVARGYEKFVRTESARPRSTCPGCRLSRAAFGSLSEFHAHVELCEQAGLQHETPSSATARRARTRARSAARGEQRTDALHTSAARRVSSLGSERRA